MNRHDWRLVPLAVGAWAGAVAGTVGPTLLAAAVAAVAAALTPAVWRRWRWCAVGLVACAILAGMSGLLAAQRADSRLRSLADDGAIVTLEFRLVSEPRARPSAPPLPSSATAQGTVRWVEGRGERTAQLLPVLLTASGDVRDGFLALVPGGRYVARARLAPPQPGDSIVAVVRLRGIDGTAAGPGPLESAAQHLRQGLRDAVAHSPPEQRALVPSLVVGDVSLVDDDMRDAFRDTGLTHLMAVSGANLALMLGVVLALLRTAGVRGWPVRVLAVGGVAMFVIICGPEPSVQRAAVMGLVALAATGAGRGRRSLRALSVAIVVLVALDPWLSVAPGFLLSVAACAGIVVLGPPWIAAMCRWAPRWCAEAFAIALASQLATQPIVTWLSDEASLVGVVANVLAGPFVGPTTVLGFAAACLTPVPWLSAAAGWAAGWASQPILWIADAGSALPASTISWEPGATGFVLMAALCVAAMRLVPPVLARSWAAALALAVIVVATMVRPTPLGWPGDWQVAFCDVGQGDATVLRADERTAVLVDAGPDAEPVIRCLQQLGIRRLAMVVLTHYHADHVGGFATIARRFQPGLVLVSPVGSPLNAVREVHATAGPGEVRAAAPGERLVVGEVAWTTVSTLEARVVAGGDEGESAQENDASVVGVAEVGGLRVLLAGDAEPTGQRHALREAERLGIDLSAHVLKLPHHGSSRQEADFFAASSARLAVASAGEDNPYGHPAAGALQLAQRTGMAIARTDEQGSIAVRLRDGSTLEVRRTGG